MHLRKKVKIYDAVMHEKQWVCYNQWQIFHYFSGRTVGDYVSKAK